MAHRIVIDTNIVISAAFWSGPPRQIVAAIRNPENDIRLLTSEAIVAEVENTLRYAKFEEHLERTGQTVEGILRSYQKMSELVTPADVPDIVRDTKDRMVLAAAAGGKAEYLVSGDKDLTSLKTYQGVTIITPIAFLAILNPPDENDQQGRTDSESVIP